MSIGEDLKMPSNQLRSNSSVRFAEKDFFLDWSDKSVLSVKMMLAKKNSRFDLNPEGATSSDGKLAERNASNKLHNLASLSLMMEIEESK